MSHPESAPHYHHNHSHDHTHDHAQAPVRVLWLAVGLTLGFALIEAIAGWFADALVLISDAAHMFTDAFSLALAAVIAALARRPADRKRSYGYGRLEMLGAFTNAVLLLLVCLAITYEAIGRLQAPPNVDAQTVTWVALIGLLINVLVARLLWPASESINVRGALLHVMSDILGSIVALITGVALLFTDWYWLDPLLSLLLCALIAFTAFGLLRDAAHQLLDGVPRELDMDEVRNALDAIDGVNRAYHLHVWRIQGDNIAMTAELELTDARDWTRVLSEAQHILHERFDIGHATLQPIFDPSTSTTEMPLQ
ncbi:MAG: cation diffusion facilitator family transporter [Pseudomonadota bacterium]